MRLSVERGAGSLPITPLFTGNPGERSGGICSSFALKQPPKPTTERVLAGIRDTSGPMTQSSDVSEAIWRTVNDPSAPLRIVAGAVAGIWFSEAVFAPS
jgi:hypothetical protein